LRPLRFILQSKLFIYLLITLIPSGLVSTLIADHQERKLVNQYKNKAQWYSNFHAMNIEKLLGETTGRLEMLATSVKVQHNNLNDLEKILKETQGKDTRFSGYYWAKPNGNLLVSTNPLNGPTNVGDRSYFQQALNTEKTSISDAHFGRVTGRFIITIATPVEEHGEMEGLILASLNLDEIESEMKKVLKDEIICVDDGANNPIIRAGVLSNQDQYIKSSMKIAQVPWTITSYIKSDGNLIFWKNFSKYLIIFMTIFSIVYLWANFLILRRKLEKEKERTEIHKLELVGNLAASTAHEIRNPLTGIKGLVKLLSEEYKDKKAQSYFEVIQTEIDRINAIVSELLVLGKPTAYTLNSFNANEISAEIEPIILSESNFMNVELTIQYYNDELLVSCVKDHLKQVILNLAKNSLQAMPNGGSLSITLQKRFEDCLITVTDTGFGMEKNQINQAFNPFYTLKKDGSGLGLTVCKRIIDTYGGEISINSILHEGTSIEISLPIDTSSHSAYEVVR
jgi:two-component system, sporulation sensor kinase D